MKTLIAGVVVAAPLALASAQSDFFWSDKGLNQGATNGDFSGDVQVGDTGSLYLYYAGASNVREGFDLDFSFDNTGVIAFTSAETLDFALVLGGIAPIGQRWGDFAGEAQSVSADAVDGLLTVNVVSGSGIRQDQTPGNLMVDQGYDMTAGAFLVAVVEYEVVGNGVASIGFDDALVVNNGAAVDTSFGGATFRSTIPTPGAAGVLAAGGLLAVRRRR